MDSPALQSFFASFDYTCLIVDSDFRILRMMGAYSEGRRTQKLRSRPVAEVLRAGLCGPDDIFRQMLQQGCRPHGWRASACLGSEDLRPVSVSAACLNDVASRVLGEDEAAYALLLRPLDVAVEGSAPVLFAGMAARSARMLAVFDLIRNLSETVVTVLVTGESGTGKELVARALHQHSPRRHGPFVAVNCAAVPDTLLESEFFGHVRGAFTGAVSHRIGRFEQAQGGTLFLDEIGEMPLALQPKLLRVLQERTFERLGESTPRPCNARLIAATNADLAAAVAERRYRADLYFRLNVVACHLPPLRERIEDIRPLASALLATMPERNGNWAISEEALRFLKSYSWPGNVRELENALEHATALSSGPLIETGHFPERLLKAADVPAAAAAPAPEAPVRPARSLDAEVLRRTLESFGWRRNETAAALGVSRTTLWRRLRTLGWVE
jgi:DNA-binding NtrC family response regulator